MPVVTFFNQKGGCGKSTTAVHFTFWLRLLQKTAIAVDADAQRSSSTWLSSLTDPIDVFRVSSPDAFMDQIAAIAHEYQFTIVDCPAGLSDLNRTILLKTDLAIIPCQPTGIDLWSSADAIKQVRQIQAVRGGRPQICMFLSKAVKGTQLKAESLSQLREFKLPIMKTVIHQRQVTAEAFGKRATVWNLPKKPAIEAREEFHNLFTEIVDFYGCSTQVPPVAAPP